ncbi:MAG: SHOCT domain-containing protein [Betaproteobacteria bacterium]|nr:SHOCT domain-containing protein [Betaproteobacteria bacterium]MDE2569913.1 SHOCT domain-containing protein [Sphingomonadales bacterium]
MMWWNGGWGGMILGPLLMIFVPAVLIAGLLLVLWRFRPPSTGPSSASPQSPLDILKERFARGEIDKEEYEERRRILSEGNDAG